MRIAFAGTPMFAQRALAALIEAGHDIALVLTQPDRPAGRGQRELPSPVKSLALQQGLPVWQPSTLRSDEAGERLGQAQVELMVVVAFGLLVPASLLGLPPRGCLNIHASLLPRWRGAAPIQRAIEAGDHQTGVCIMQMDEGLDTGPVLACESTTIGPEETAGALHDRLALLGAALMVKTLQALSRGELAPQPQPAQGATYARKLDRSESALDWRDSAEVLARRIRAFDPVPGATARLARLALLARQTDAGLLRLSRARVITPSGEGPSLVEPGTVLSATGEGVQVACGGGGVLVIGELQRPGGRRLAAAEFLRGCPLFEGERFECLAPSG